MGGRRDKSDRRCVKIVKRDKSKETVKSQKWKELKVDAKVTV